jgi:hypothetical protein
MSHIHGLRDALIAVNRTGGIRFTATITLALLQSSAFGFTNAPHAAPSCSPLTFQLPEVPPPVNKIKLQPTKNPH